MNFASNIPINKNTFISKKLVILPGKKEIDWKILSRECSLEKDFLLKYIDEISWDILFCRRDISSLFLIKNFNKEEILKIVKKIKNATFFRQKLTMNLLEMCIKIFLNNVGKCEFYLWETIIENQNLTQKFKKKYRKELGVTKISKEVPNTTIYDKIHDKNYGFYEDFSGEFIVFHDEFFDDFYERFKYYENYGYNFKSFKREYYDEIIEIEEENKKYWSSN